MEWDICEIPIPFDGDYMEQKELGLPEDAQLVDIEILLP